MTYFEDDSTDGGTGLGKGELLVSAEISFESFVSEAVLIVKSAKRQSVGVVEFHDVVAKLCHF